MVKNMEENMKIDEIIYEIFVKHHLLNLSNDEYEYYTEKIHFSILDEMVFAQFIFNQIHDKDEIYYKVFLAFIKRKCITDILNRLSEENIQYTNESIFIDNFEDQDVYCCWITIYNPIPTYNEAETHMLEKINKYIDENEY